MSPLRILGKKRGWLLLYGALVVASSLFRWATPERAPLPPGMHARKVEQVRQGTREPIPARLAYRVEGSRDRPVVVLLHGSPGHHGDFDTVLPALSAEYRVLAPDLPGFGASETELPDYSIRAHADYVLQLLDLEGVDEAHLVGFSMGGGVALHVAELAPERVRSMTLLASIGVEELELLGDHTLNHAIHGLQLALLWALREGTPHFGGLDGAMLGVPYARNFYDSDQRPLRGILSRYAGPMLILHGEKDFLVPVAAAREHARIVPQAELVIRDDAGHFLPFLQGAWVAGQIAEFVQLSEANQATLRAQVEPSRQARAREPFDPSVVPPASGTALLVFVGLIALSTLVSEDLACIGTGLLVADGRLGFIAGSFACLLGIFVGDIALFLAGRFSGRAALGRAPLKWMISPARVKRSADWFEKKGLSLIVLSRFAPGTRLPTYFAAGLVGTKLSTFSAYFLLAAVIWTPLLVAISAWLGSAVLEFVAAYERWALPALLLVILTVLAIVRVVVPALTWRGRRSLVGSWRRWTQWEFWPRWLFYPPVVARILALGARYRAPALFTAANPAMPEGGFVGESKSAILEGLAGAGDRVARWRLLPAKAAPEERRELVERFCRDNDLSLPLVIKPDRGERGSGVAVLRDGEALSRRLAQSGEAELVQEFVGGEEFGVFYARRPSEERGRIISITRKVLPHLEGDGARTIEELVYADKRAVIMAGHYLEANAHRLQRVPARGERVRLVDLGTHCRGALFLDANELLTPQLEVAIDEISRGYEGFYFGRYDLRARDDDALREGRDFKILELNGVTSEVTHIYDPESSLRGAYRALFDQWALAFEIGAENRDRGVPVSSALGLLASLRR